MAPKEQREENRALIEILDQEFARLRSKGEGQFATQEAMAERLQIDKTALSHYRAGRALTRKRAQEFARALRDSLGEQQELAERLFAARPTSPQVAVHDWFLQHARSEYLLLVEFRELPAVRPSGSKGQLARDVAQAIANGLTYGMLFPYDLKPTRPMLEPVRSYISRLHAHVIQTYGAILDHVLDQVFDSFQKSKLRENGEKLGDRLEAAASRLKLYTLKDSEGSSCPAIGYRLFYVEKSLRDGNEAERWEWVSTGGAEQMIHKESSPDELEATRIRFFPIPEFWRENGRLPASSAEMLKIVNGPEYRYYAESYNLEGTPRWEVYREDRTTEDIVADFLELRKNG